MTSDFPIAMFCPYLSLADSYEFGDYWLGPLDSFDGEWQPPELQDHVTTLLSRFATVSGQPVSQSTLVARRDGVVDGKPPPLADALHLAIAFGVLIGNPRHPIDESESWRVTTADNYDVWIQQIDLVNNRLAIERGSRVRNLTGGYRYHDANFRISALPELHSDGRATFDAEVAEAVYRIVAEPARGADPQLAHRLHQAIRWWVKAWQNSASVDWEDRVVYLRTAVDALVGSNKTKQALGLV